MRGSVVFAAVAAALLAAGCAGPQSTLTPAGRDAERIAELWWWMAAGAVAIWSAVTALAIYAIRTRADPHLVRPGHRLIAWGGGVFPTVVLAILLAFALPILPRLLEPGPRGGLRIEITGETWWWRVRYHAPDGGQVELANEIRLPVGERVELTLTSADVIHSFWIPSLGGKVDMIPGRVNRLALEPTRTGVFRGACAEFCGASHAYMNLVVVVTERDEFDRWLDSQRAPAATTSDPLALQGQAIFLANACRECHTVRGTRASATTGPDLTHVGSRLSLGADLLANDRAAFERWVEDAGAIKPSVRMPSFDFLTTGEIQALAAYLDGLL